MDLRFCNQCSSVIKCDINLYAAFVAICEIYVARQHPFNIRITQLIPKTKEELILLEKNGFIVSHEISNEIWLIKPRGIQKCDAYLNFCFHPTLHSKEAVK